MAKAMNMNNTTEPTIEETVTGLSYSDIGRMTGLSRKQVSKILQGRCTKPQHETVVQLAKGLGFGLDEMTAYLERATAAPTPYRGGRQLDEETIEEIKARPELTTREAEEVFGVSRETVSKVMRFG